MNPRPSPARLRCCAGEHRGRTAAAAQTVPPVATSFAMTVANAVAARAVPSRTTRAATAVATAVATSVATRAAPSRATRTASAGATRVAITVATAVATKVTRTQAP